MKKMNKKGFTIVELVIVIAVIGILAGVLIPTFAGIVGDADEAAAEQKARNAYVEYFSEHHSDVVDYVAIEDENGVIKYYAVNDWDNVTTTPTAGKYYIAEGDCNEANCDCDCGWDKDVVPTPSNPTPAG